MINIAKKKLPSPIMFLLVYISYCAAGWFAARGELVYYTYAVSYGGLGKYDASAFFMGGVIPFLLYTAASSFIFKSMIVKLPGDVKSIKYGLHFSVIAANVALFLLKFIYIAAPIAAAMMEIILDPLVTIAFVALYMWYAFKMDYVEKPIFRIVLKQVLGTFLSVYGLLAAVSLILSLV